MSKLYELSKAYNEVWNMVDDEADLQMIEDTLQGIEGEIEVKAESIVKLMKDIESDEQKIKSEEERLYNRRKALENRRESIKKFLESNLITTGIDKVKTHLFTIAMQNNPKSVSIYNEQALRDYDKEHTGSWWKFRPAEYTIDKTELKKVLESNPEAVPGVELQQTKSLRVR